MSVVPEAVAEIVPHVGGQKTLTDGIHISTPDGKCTGGMLQIPEDLHIQGSNLSWADWQLGDRGWLVVIHPSGDGSPAAAISQGATTVDVGPALAPYYDPAITGATHMELWNSDFTDLKEVRSIASRSGDIITLGEAITQGPYTTSDKIKVILDFFSPIRGADGKDQGAKFVKDGGWDLYNPHQITEVIPAGTCLGARVQTVVASAADRCLAATFVFRRP